MALPFVRLPRLLRSSDHRRMAWKNGLGETTEIAVAPEGAGLSAFDWRVSMASVTTDGAFSAFPGVDRTLSILSGAGLRLSVDGRAHDLTAASAPFSFPADRPAEAALLGGPVIDLNIMTRRDAWTHRVRRIDVAPGVPVVLEAAWILAFCAGDALELTSAGASYSLNRNDALAVAAAEGGAWRVRAAASASLYLVTLDPVTARQDTDGH